jgi:hypothetical protein
MGGDPEVVGRVIEVGGQSLEVIGIAPKGFQGLNQSIGRPDSDLWVPMSLVHEISGRDPFANQYCPGARFVDDVGRMRAGDDIGRVLAELEVLAPQVAGSVGGDREDLYRAEVRRVAMVDPSDAGPMIALVFPIPILVLVVGCLNAANLFLVRASGRGHEIAVRTAIGASRWRIVRQLLFESLVLASASAAVALPLAWAGLSVSHRFLLIPMPIDMLVLSLSVITAWGVALGFGLWPAIRVTGRRPARMLGLPHASPSGVQGRLRGRRALVVVQVAVSLSLLASGTQLISTLESLGGTAGTAPDQLLMGSFDLAQLGLC